MRAMREETNAARTQGLEWRSVVDSLRPRTGSIWSSWPDRERRRFMRHARPYWEIHRHRMAPEVEARIVSLRRSHPGWGPRTILSKLRRELAHPPSRSSIYRCRSATA